jgi:hypothetical protein
LLLLTGAGGVGKSSVREVLAAPSASALDGFSACLLDCSREVQRARLARRGDPPAWLPHDVAFADWMRGVIG